MRNTRNGRRLKVSDALVILLFLVLSSLLLAQGLSILVEVWRDREHKQGSGWFVGMLNVVCGLNCLVTVFAKTLAYYLF